LLKSGRNILRLAVGAVVIEDSAQYAVSGIACC
jgi:hypothetical protein